MKDDINGRSYVERSHLKPGQLVEFDEGFGCLMPYSPYEVIIYENEPCVACNRGLHYLTAQDEGDGFLIGVYPLRLN